jgi:ABC-type antimicrobial peptide transport system permease subunit
MVMTEAVLLVGIGLMLGLGAAVSVGNLAAKLPFGVQPRDTMTFASATLLHVLVAIAAGYIPARRATRVEPATALRNG